MFENRKKVFIVVSIVIGLIIAVILFWLFYSKSKTGPNTETLPLTSNDGVISSSTVAGNNNLTNSNNVSNKAPKAPPAELYPEQLAKIFVERLLSYSNQNNNQHIEDMLPLATTEMSKWMEKQKLEFSNEYQGVNTIVISSSVKEMKGDKATVEVGIRQVFEGIKSEVVYKTGRVELMMLGGSWKVDGLYWNK